MKPSDRTSLIRLAATLPKGSAERKSILAGLQKKSERRPSLAITVAKDPERNDQPYVEFTTRHGTDRYYQVGRGKWSNALGGQPMKQLVDIAEMILAGKL